MIEIFRNITSMCRLIPLFAVQCILFPPQFLSTSPEQEPESFYESIRAALIQLRDFPNPLQTVFQGGKAKIYTKEKNSGSWQLQLV